MMMNKENEITLERFIRAQETDYEQALEEIRAGRKRSHWIWYIFPQIRGLGRSHMSEYYGIQSLEEAVAYAGHPVLGARLREISQALLALDSSDPWEVMGPPDDMKLKSSMTLFGAAAPEEPVFQKVLDKFFGGRSDGATLKILERQKKERNSVRIRPYGSSDCREMAELFYDTVHTVNAADYRKEQLDVWATGEVDLEKWDQSFLAHNTVVAEADGRIVGFGDMDETGYLDRLYVHKDYQRQGIASAICNELEKKVKGKVVTHASITARPFFEKRGYRVVREQQVERQGILLVNFVMEKYV